MLLALIVMAAAIPATHAAVPPTAAVPADDRLKVGETALFQDHDYPTAFAVLNTLAVERNALAQYGLGYMYDRGLVPGSVADHRTALLFYEEAARGGAVKAMVPYALSRAQAGDLDEAMAWLRLASANGDADATALIARANAAGDAGAARVRSAYDQQGYQAAAASVGHSIGCMIGKYCGVVPPAYQQPIHQPRPPFPPLVQQPLHCTANLLKDVMGRLTYTCR